MGAAPPAITVLAAGTAAPCTDINCNVVWPHWNHWPGSNAKSVIRWPLNQVPLVLPTSRHCTLPLAK